MRTAIWQGLPFIVFDHEYSLEHLPDKKGVYIIAGLNQANKWVPLYIGQSSSLAERPATHERWKEAESLGGTHIHYRVVQHQEDRNNLEELLIRTYQPRLNTQLKKIPENDGPQEK
jgi:excinuclease UvrABC nuclease subunit